MMQSTQIPKPLQEQIALLLECQDKQGMTSCFECAKVLECELRNAYIDAVYASMSGGSNTEFDF